MKITITVSVSSSFSTYATDKAELFIRTFLDKFNLLVQEEKIMCIRTYFFNSKVETLSFIRNKKKVIHADCMEKKEEFFCAR